MKASAPSLEQRFEFLARLGGKINWNNFSPEEVQLLVKGISTLGPRVERALDTWIVEARCRKQSFERLKIDRSKLFDPAFIGEEEWKIEEQDERSLVLTEVNLTDVQWKTMLEGRETSVNGEEKLKRLKKAGHIRLDAKVFQTLWENQILIPEHWKEETNGNITFIYFDGTVLRNSDGRRCVLCLYWRDGTWYWRMFWLGFGSGVNYPSAVLPKVA